MMVLFDSCRVVLFAFFLASSIRFYYLAWKTRNSYPHDPIVQSHFFEHSTAAIFAFCGSLLGTVWSFAHLFSPNQGELSEYPFTIVLILMGISGTLFMVHMIKEQTPGHEYYIREVGDYTDPATRPKRREEDYKKKLSKLETSR